MNFSDIRFFRNLLILLTGTVICSDVGAAAVRVATFGTQLPSLISNIVDVSQVTGSIIPLFTQLQGAITPEEMKVFLAVTDAYARKDYENMGFSGIGTFFDTSIPPMMNSFLALYPFIRLTVNHIGEPVTNLFYDLGNITGSTLAKNFCGELKQLIESRAIERTFTAFNNLDDLLKNGLLPRMSALFVELDDLLKEAKDLGSKI